MVNDLVSGYDILWLALSIYLLANLLYSCCSVCYIVLLIIDRNLYIVID